MLDQPSADRIVKDVANGRHEILFAPNDAVVKAPLPQATHAEGSGARSYLALYPAHPRQEVCSVSAADDCVNVIRHDAPNVDLPVICKASDRLANLTSHR